MASPGAATHSQRGDWCHRTSATGDDSDALINLGKIDQMDFRSLLNLETASTSHDVILLSENLTRAFNGVTVVADVSIEIQRGRLTELLP